MKALLPIFFCLLLSCSDNKEATGEGNGSYGVEQTATKAIFYDTLEGKEIFEIYGGVDLTSIELESNWVLGEFVLSISEENYESAMLFSGDSIKNSFHENIGLVLADFPLWRTGEWEGEYVGVIRASTPDQNLLPASVLERSLEASLPSAANGLDELEMFIVGNRLKFEELFPGYQSYYQLENEMITQFPGYRLILIFSGQNLKGIFHSRNIDLPFFTQKKTRHGEYFSFPSDIEVGEKESLLQAFQKLHED